MKSLNLSYGWLIICCIITLSLSLNFYGGPLLSTLAIILLVGLILFSKENKELCLFPILFIFFAHHSQLKLLIGGMDIPRETLHNLLFLLIFFKTVLVGKNKVTFKDFGICVFLILAYWSISQALFIKISQGLAIFCQVYVTLIICKKMISNDTQFNYHFLIAFIIALVGEYAYGSVTPKDALFTLQNNWRADQFGGLFDPNNCSIHFLFGFAMVNIFYRNYFSRLIRIPITIFFSYVILTTISFSGIAALLCLFVIAFMFNPENTNSKQKYVVGALFALLVYVVIKDGLIMLLQQSSVSAFNSLGERLEGMNDALLSGNTNELTSNRENLSLLYFIEFGKMGFLQQTFGSPEVFKEIVSRLEVASHNFYLDSLIQYGYLGVGLIITTIINILRRYIMMHQIGFLLFSLMFVVLMYSRTLPEYYLVFSLFICNYGTGTTKNFSCCNSIQR